MQIFAPKKNTDTKGCIRTSNLLSAIGEILQNEIQNDVIFKGACSKLGREKNLN